VKNTSGSPSPEEEADLVSEKVSPRSTPKKRTSIQVPSLGSSKQSSSEKSSCDIDHKSKHRKKGNVNIRAVFLHIMADALGSVAVIFSALIIKYVDGGWTLYVDPFCTLFMVCISLYPNSSFHSPISIPRDIAILLSVTPTFLRKFPGMFSLCLTLCQVTLIGRTAYPLLKESMNILLDKSPPHVDIPVIRDKLSRISGVVNVHELQIWQVTQGTLMATVHLIIDSSINRRLSVAMDILDRAKRIMHKHDIHDSVVQREYILDSQSSWNDASNPCFDLVCDENECLTLSNSTMRGASPEPAKKGGSDV